METIINQYDDLTSSEITPEMEEKFNQRVIEILGM
jgi:hypothetical protein